MVPPGVRACEAMVIGVGIGELGRVVGVLFMMRIPVPVGGST